MPPSAAPSSRKRPASFAVDAALPWDDIDSRVTKEFLLEEKEKAERGEVTLDCRWGACEDCGVCEDDIEMRIAKP